MPPFSQDILHELYLSNSQQLAFFIRSRCSDEQDVADILHESFLRLSQYLNSEQVQNPRSFLYQIAANMVVDWHRRHKTRALHDAPDVDISYVAGTQPNPECYWESREAIGRFNRWLEELPPLQRHAFVLYRIEGCRHVEIARRLGISESSSERYVKAAMLHISKRMDDY